MNQVSSRGMAPDSSTGAGSGDHVGAAAAVARAFTGGSHCAVPAPAAQFSLALLLAHDLRLDPAGLVVANLSTNEQRYPVEKSRGRATTYDRLEAKFAGSTSSPRQLVRATMVQTTVRALRAPRRVAGCRRSNPLPVEAMAWPAIARAQLPDGAASYRK